MGFSYKLQKSIINTRFLLLVRSTTIATPHPHPPHAQILITRSDCWCDQRLLIILIRQITKISVLYKLQLYTYIYCHVLTIDYQMILYYFRILGSIMLPCLYQFPHSDMQFKHNRMHEDNRVPRISKPPTPPPLSKKKRVK